MAEQLNPTPEQAAIIEAARAGRQLVIQAGAGTGKTSTLKMVAQTVRDTTVLYIAFNKAIATEAAASFPAHAQCRTAHSLAFAAVGRDYRHRLGGPRQTARRAAELLGTTWIDLRRDLQVSPVQVARIAVETVRAFCYSADDEPKCRHVPYQTGILGEDHKNLAAAVLPYARRAWSDLRDRDGMLRFEHDHHLKMWALTRPRLDAQIVMLDEAQDSNPVVAELVKQQQDHAQLIAVGDSNQSMYEWRGARDALRGWPADECLYLSQSWRFGPVIATEANKWLAQLDTPLRLTGNPAQDSRLATLDAPRAVLCRTNAEAMRQVMTSLAAGRRVALVGGATTIRNLARAAADLQAGRRTSHPELYAFTTWAGLQEYVETEAAGRDLKPFVDLIDAHGTDAILEAAAALVEERRAQTIVSTAHKAKGREWNSVKIADDYPEPRQNGGGDPGGEGGIPRTDAMLAYVAVTRARCRLDRGGLAWIDRYAHHRQDASAQNPGGPCGRGFGTPAAAAR
ncbi:UvrD-helicase domain-containing protein [Mycobacterium talmoniae]|uniref:DNA helicase n=1 Tax=Mycobacterium talmoniae TaxID=1858794 RepID=A0A1S1NH18_9MYCO|nr:UvrD-helicase domain-containing protein [Mycobacterium talmoniae]OHV03712.1 DNA helicase [Mycobacterium talmoniae]